MREDLIRPMHGVTSDWSLLLHPVKTRACRAKTQSYDDTIDLKNQISPGSRPSFREDLRIPIPRFHQGISESNTGTGTEKSIVPYQCPPFWSVAGQKRDNTAQCWRSRKRGRWKSDNSFAQYKKIWKTGTDPVRSQQKATDLALEELVLGRPPIRGRFYDPL